MKMLIAGSRVILEQWFPTVFCRDPLLGAERSSSPGAGELPTCGAARPLCTAALALPP